MSSARVQNIVPFASSALFCENCGMMLALDTNMGPVITCKFCKHNSEISKLIGSEIVHKKVFN